ELQDLKSFPTRRSSDLRTQITDRGIKVLSGLKNIRLLILDETEISDVGLKTLEGMKNLQLLGLGETKVSENGITDFRKALPNCRSEEHTSELQSPYDLV